MGGLNWGHFPLTADVDTIVGTIGNDLFVGQLGGTATVTPLDYIDGAGGNNSFDIYDIAGGSALPAGLTVKNVQVMNLSAAGAAGASLTPFDTTGITGLTNLNVLQSSGNDYVTVGNGTAVSVIDTKAAGAVAVTATDSAVTVSAAGKVTVAGGSTQTVTTAGGVALSGATGAITVTDTAAAASTIDDGTTVTLTTSAKAAGGTTGTIKIGNTAAATPVVHTPTGAVTVTDNLSNVAHASGAGGDGTGGAITIAGGTTVSVTETAVQAAMTTASTNSTLTQAAVTVTGTAATTAVTVTQAAAVGAVDTALAIAAVTESSAVTFNVLKAGDSLAVGGLVFKAGAANLTAAQVAAAFASLADGATQGNSVLGTYSGAVSGWTSGAVSTASVAFTSTATGPQTNLSAGVVLTNTSTFSVAPTYVEVDGVAVFAATGKGGIVGGAVTINDVNALSTTKAGVITSATLDGYGATGVASNSLATLSLANSAKAVTIYNDKTSGLGATSLALTVNKLGAASTLNLDGTTAAYKTLNVTTAGSDSTLAVTGAAVTAVTVAGAKVLTLGAGLSAAALKTITVSGAAGLKFASLAAVTDINASATSGAVTITNLDATTATYEGGSGVDKVTLVSTTITKAISLGAGNDTLTLASGTTTAGAAVSGGDGTDTLAMVAADAVTASASALFATKVTAFEVLALTGGTGAQTVHVDVLGNYNSVSTGAEATGGVLTLDGFTSGGTLTLTSSAVGTGAYVVSSTAFATPTTDTFNVALTAAGAVAAGSVTAAAVESLTISATDSTADVVAGVTADSLTLLATSASTFTIPG